MIYNIIKQLISFKKTDGLRAKIDVFHLAGSLSESEYLELIALLEASINQE